MTGEGVAGMTDKGGFAREAEKGRNVNFIRLTKFLKLRKSL